MHMYVYTHDHIYCSQAQPIMGARHAALNMIHSSVGEVISGVFEYERPQLGATYLRLSLQ